MLRKRVVSVDCTLEHDVDFAMRASVRELWWESRTRYASFPVLTQNNEPGPIILSVPDEERVWGRPRRKHQGIALPGRSRASRRVLAHP